MERLAVCVALALLAFGCVASQQQANQAANGSGLPHPAATVKIQNFSFAPATLFIRAGTTVTWRTLDAAGHSVAADDGSFIIGKLQQGEENSFTFDMPGNYTYHCAQHPYMKGTIIVN